MIRLELEQRPDRVDRAALVVILGVLLFAVGALAVTHEQPTERCERSAASELHE